jgi:hypothetical protein
MSISVAITPLALELAATVAGTCFVVGVALIGVGGVLGFQISKKELDSHASAKLAEASKQLDTAHARIRDTRQEVENLQGGNLEGVQSAAAGVRTAAADAESSASAAKSALEQVSGIVGALPENLRFSAVLMLVGMVLVSVATTQFGGTSLF